MLVCWSGDQAMIVIVLLYLLYVCVWQANPETTMRMLCLLSVTTDGLQPAVYTALKTQFAHVRLLALSNDLSTQPSRHSMLMYNY